MDEASAKVRQFRLAKKGMYHSVCLLDMGNSCTSVFPKQSRMGTATTKYDKETDEDGKQRAVSMERSKTDTNKRTEIR